MIRVQRAVGWSRVVLVATAVTAVVALGASPASALKPTGRGGNGGGGNGGGGSVSSTGNDVSYPQCGTTLPTGQAFGIVGLTGGLADTPNACFGPTSAYPSYSQSELYWAVATSVGGTTQPAASLYVNTADPGNVYNGTVIADWPTSGSTPYGTCATTQVTVSNGPTTVGADSDACAWQYGFDRATQDSQWLTQAADAIDGQSPPVSVSATPGAYPWWLDVETANTWQSDLTMNVADLQGMIAGLQSVGVTSVGVYSTSTQWDSITGGTSSASGSLYQLPNWIPGSRTSGEAQSACSQTSFTSGSVVLTQWAGHPVDGDVAC